MDTPSNHEKGGLENSNETNDPVSKVVVVTNLTRKVVQEHLQTIFGFYGEVLKLDLPLFGKCTSQMPFLCKSCLGTHEIVPAGQNRGKAALEHPDAASAQKVFSHMNGGQLDGATPKVELSDLPTRPQHVSCSPRW